MTTNSPLQKILQGILHTDTKANKTMKGQSSIDSTAHNQTLKQQKQLNDRNRNIPINTNTEY
jgi:hypothetical protein